MLEFLRFGVGKSYVWGLVIFTFGGWIFTFGGLEFLRLRVSFYTFVGEIFTSFWG